MFGTTLERHGWQPDPQSLARAEGPGDALDRALGLALDLAGVDQPDLPAWREAMQLEARRRLYPHRFSGEALAQRVADCFFPLAQAVLPALAAQAPGGVAALLPFAPLAPEERDPWPAGAEYRRLLEHLETEGFLVLQVHKV